MGRKDKRLAQRNLKKLQPAQKKILARMEYISDLVSELSTKELFNIVNTKRIVIPPDINIRCSSTDLVTIHQVLKEKYIKEKGEENGQ